jgi:transmembrane sensor
MFNKSAIKVRKLIIHLLHKHVKGELSLKERSELDEWAAKSEENQRLLSEVSNQQTLASDMASFSRFEWNDIAQKLAARGVPMIENIPIRRTIYWGRFMAAAAALLIMVIASYLLVEKKRKSSVVNKQEVVVKQDDILPGKYKARLTLSDGTILILDSASSGRLVQQGGSTVLNKDGKLIYEKGGETNKVLYNTLTTAKGETYGMVLSDGSKVWLNSQSSIRYPVLFNGDKRKVEITGEAYFEISTAYLISDNGESEKIPFVVSVNDMEVDVLGTKFNINSYTNEDASTATLLEGKVKVLSTSNNTIAILQPGEQASLNKQSKQLNKQNDVDVDKAVAWRFGYFQFNNDDLQMVLRQLSRWYDVDVVYQGPVPKETFWGKILRNNSLSQVLETLHSSDVHFKIEGKKIIVSL